MEHDWMSIWRRSPPASRPPRPRRRRGSGAPARAGQADARERLASLLTRAASSEIGALVTGLVERRGARPQVAADAVVTGWGRSRAEDRRVADDGSVMGGAAGLLNVSASACAAWPSTGGCPSSGSTSSAIRFQDSMDAAIMSRVPAFKEVIECAGASPRWRR
jgi:hypothetical protein